MKIQVSHESPISLLDQSLYYNDYAYALVHLFETHTEYYNFFKVLRMTSNTPVLLDNSIFELGESFDEDRYAYWIKELNPNYYIVPDKLEDAHGTMSLWSHFNLRYSDKISSYSGRPDSYVREQKIGVVQGKTWQDLIDCYYFMSKSADCIAISFDYSYYQTTGTGTTKLERMCSGRQRFIQQLIDEGKWNWNKPHHLLGCSLAREFRYYVDNNIYNIRSCDTSNPVVAAIHGLYYNDDFGLNEKPSTLLADLIDHEMSNSQMETLKYNVKMFKKIIRRK